MSVGSSVETDKSLARGHEDLAYNDLLLTDYNNALRIRTNLMRSNLRMIIKKFKQDGLNYEIYVNPPLDWNRNENSDGHENRVTYHIKLTNRNSKKAINISMTKFLTTKLKSKGFKLEEDIGIFKNEEKGTYDFYFFEEISAVFQNARKFGAR